MKLIKCFFIFYLSNATFAHAQNKTLYEDYNTQTSNSGNVETLDTSLFGDQTDVYTGATEFLVTDIDLRGNNSLPVAIQRKLTAYDEGLGNMLVWSLPETPYLRGIFAKNAGWKSSDLVDQTRRCSSLNGPPEPPEVDQTDGQPDRWESSEYWHGNQMYIPGNGFQKMQRVLPNDANKPVAGGPYYWVTQDRWYFSCLPNLKNGSNGEGFLAISPNGDKYFFDWLIENASWAPALTKVNIYGSETVLQRNVAKIFATRIEDRFGNWVIYNYSGTTLNSISSSDGRSLTITQGLPGTNTWTVTDGTRVWSYDYSSGAKVTYPDGSVWSSTVSNSLVRQSSDCVNLGQVQRYSGSATLLINHPSKAVGQFKFSPTRTGISFVPAAPGGAPDECNIPSRFDNVSVSQKSISGPALSTRTWNYTYGPANNCYVESGGCSVSSPTTRFVEVLQPDNGVVRYTFGNQFRQNEGQLLTLERVSPASITQRIDSFSWFVLGEVGSSPSSAGYDYLGLRKRVEQTHAMTQDGGVFTTEVLLRDSFGRPTKIARYSNSAP